MYKMLKTLEKPRKFEIAFRKKSDYNMQGKYRDEGVVSRTKGILSNGTGNFRLC